VARSGSGAVPERKCEPWMHALQNAEKDGKINFTNKLVSVRDTSWSCSDGSTQHSLFTVTSVRPLDFTADGNPNGKVTGWTLNGLSKTDFGAVSGCGERFPTYACPAGAYSRGSMWPSPPRPPCRSTASTCRPPRSRFRPSDPTPPPQHPRPRLTQPGDH
jgi:hypothetical protein